MKWYAKVRDYDGIEHEYELPDHHMKIPGLCRLIGLCAKADASDTLCEAVQEWISGFDRLRTAR